ncbi:hypothetical protein NDU88_006099 [Pleurodeles waltl]|uniref:Uncharacterized protein n=1 Tax=Pleurodeles waltl TaxID=8319 RepID=A0AAV7NU54_PLEWA|nr:hypothetical protein NDU88_006099 [Pleurodeles waltl]
MHGLPGREFEPWGKGSEDFRSSRSVKPARRFAAAQAAQHTPHRDPYGLEHCSLDSNLGDIRSEHERLGLHVPMEIKEKIWKGAYIDIFDLLVDRPERDEVKHCKESAHSRDCGHGPHKRKVEESLNNWVRAFSICQSIIAECLNDQGALLACYQNRIAGAHDEYGGTAWKDYDREFRRIKANKPGLGWDQIDIIAWLRFTNRPHGNRLQPFSARSGAASGPPG